MVYGGDKKSHIRPQDVEFVGLTGLGDIGPNDQRDSAVFQSLHRANADQFIQDGPDRHITTEAFYQFTECRTGAFQRKRSGITLGILEGALPPPGSNHPGGSVVPLNAGAVIRSREFPHSFDLLARQPGNH